MADIDRRTFNKAALGLGVSATLMDFLAACSSSGGSSTSSSPSGPRTLTIGLDSAPASLDPAQLISGGTVVLMWQAVFDTLLRYKPDGTIVPNAAQSFTFTDNNTVLTLKLRPNMKYTDGSPVNAASAKASLEHMQKGGGADSSRLANVQFATPDDSTVVLTASEPKGLLPMYLCLAAGVTASTASLTAKDVATNPVGSGPYKLDPAHTTSGATWTFVRNPDYWNKAAYPYDTVVMKLMSDVTARLNALSSGQINAAQITSQTQPKAQSSGLSILQDHVNWAGLFLADRNGKQIPALANVKVRQAINMVFDRKAIITALFQGNATLTNQVFNDKSGAFLPGLVNQYPFDVAKAKQLMSDAGYAGGFSVNIPSITGLDYANPLMVQQLGVLNIKATQVKVPDNQVFTELLGGGKFPIFFFTLESRTPLWDIVQSLQPTSIWNMYHSTDPALTPLLDKAQVATGDAVNTNAQAINKFLIDQAWFAPWALPVNFWALDSKTKAEPTLGSTAPYLITFK